MIWLILMFILIMMKVIMMIFIFIRMIAESFDHDGICSVGNHDIDGNHDKGDVDRTDRIMIMADVIVIIKSD